jgi:glycosyltransferase involved in cell wall biosynthesis
MVYLYEKVYHYLERKSMFCRKMVKSDISDKRVIVCGAARDVGKHLNKFFKRTHKAFRDFAVVDFIICESNSQDESYEILTKLQNKYPNLMVIRDNSPDSVDLKRTVRIASARNLIQQFIKAKSADYDYVVMMDLDGINRSLNRKSVVSCWNYEGWDVATANQPFQYYDLWALRAEGWITGDIWQEFELQRVNNNTLKTSQFLREYSRAIPRKLQPIPVISAFGGLGIYRIDCFLKGAFSGSDKYGREICEHVPFNENLTRYGYKIFIIPSLVNLNYTSQLVHKSMQNLQFLLSKPKRTSDKLY